MVSRPAAEWGRECHSTLLRFGSRPHPRCRAPPRATRRDLWRKCHLGSIRGSNPVGGAPEPRPGCRSPRLDRLAQGLPQPWREAGHRLGAPGGALAGALHVSPVGPGDGVDDGAVVGVVDGDHLGLGYPLTGHVHAHLAVLPLAGVDAGIGGGAPPLLGWIISRAFRPHKACNTAMPAGPPRAFGSPVGPGARGGSGDLERWWPSHKLTLEHVAAGPRHQRRAPGGAVPVPASLVSGDPSRASHAPREAGPADSRMRGFRRGSRARVRRSRRRSRAAGP